MSEGRWWCSGLGAECAGVTLSRRLRLRDAMRGIRVFRPGTEGARRGRSPCPEEPRVLVSNVGKCVDDRGLAWEQPTTAPGAAGRSASASRSGGRRAEPSCQRCPPASAGAQGSGPGLLRVRSLRDLAAGLSFTRLAPAAWRGVLAAALVAAGGLALAEPALGQAEVELLNTTLTP